MVYGKCAGVYGERDTHFWDCFQVPFKFLISREKLGNLSNPYQFPQFFTKNQKFKNASRQTEVLLSFKKIRNHNQIFPVLRRHFIDARKRNDGVIQNIFPSPTLQLVLQLPRTSLQFISLGRNSVWSRDFWYFQIKNYNKTLLN